VETSKVVAGPVFVVQEVVAPVIVQVGVATGATFGALVPVTVAVNVIVVPRVFPTLVMASEAVMPYALSPVMFHNFPAPVKVFLAVKPA